MRQQDAQGSRCRGYQ